MLTTLQDGDIAGLIDRATTRCVFVAPGVSKTVADALTRAIKRQVGQWVVIVDGDEETCRLGYGDADALQRLFDSAVEASLTLRKQPGIRLGLVLSDDDLIVWSPTPLMFEAPRERSERMRLCSQRLQSKPYRWR